MDAEGLRFSDGLINLVAVRGDVEMGYGSMIPIIAAFFGDEASGPSIRSWY